MLNVGLPEAAAFAAAASTGGTPAWVTPVIAAGAAIAAALVTALSAAYVARRKVAELELANSFDLSKQYLESVTLDRDRPEILQPPEHPQACCAQQTITVPPGVLAKTAQKHDYPSAAWRRSYSRRTGAERGFATVKDPAASDIARGWCRLLAWRR